MQASTREAAIDGGSVRTRWDDLDARASTSDGELFIRLNAQSDFTAGCDKNDVGWTLTGIGEDVSPLCDSRSRSEFLPIESRERLAGENKSNWFVPILHDDPPGFNHLVGVCGSNRDEARNHP